MKAKLDFVTLQEKVASTLREAILTQQLESGERLVQDELASKLGVSRMPIREALKGLEREGLVKVVPHKGAVVSYFTINDLEEIYYLRSMLEGIAVQKSMNHLQEKDRGHLYELVEKMDEDVNKKEYPSFVEHNLQFHELLKKGCNWKRVKQLTTELWNGYPQHVPSLLPETIKQSNEEHKYMLVALENKDPVKLKSLIKSYIDRSGDALIMHLGYS